MTQWCNLNNSMERLQSMTSSRPASDFKPSGRCLLLADVKERWSRSNLTVRHPPQRQEQLQVSFIVPPVSQKQTTEALKQSYKKVISVVLAPPLLCVAPPTPVFYLRLHCTSKSCILIGYSDCLSNVDHTSSVGAMPPHWLLWRCRGRFRCGRSCRRHRAHRETDFLSYRFAKLYLYSGWFCKVSVESLSSFWCNCAVATVTSEPWFCRFHTFPVLSINAVVSNQMQPFHSESAETIKRVLMDSPAVITSTFRPLCVRTLVMWPELPIIFVIKHVFTCWTHKTLDGLY